MTTRRSFLAGILAAGVAPAVLSQGSAMRIWVPRDPFLVLGTDPLWSNVQWLAHSTIAVADDESALVAIDPHGVRGFISGVPWAPRRVVYNEHWMPPTAPWPS